MSTAMGRSSLQEQVTSGRLLARSDRLWMTLAIVRKATSERKRTIVVSSATAEIETTFIIQHVLLVGSKKGKTLGLATCSCYAPYQRKLDRGRTMSCGPKASAVPILAPIILGMILVWCTGMAQ